MKTPERTPQRTTEEIKRGLETCIGECRANKPHCPYHTCGNGCMDTMNRDALALIQQLEAKDTKQYQIIAELNARYSQVSKALCGNENATLEEALQAVEQVKQNKPSKKLICQITIPTAADILRKIEEVELDGKTFAEWLELVKGYKQLEADLEAVKRERDALLEIIRGECFRCRWIGTGKCASCRHDVDTWNAHDDCWEWEGVCPENTKEEK